VTISGFGEFVRGDNDEPEPEPELLRGIFLSDNRLLEDSPGVAISSRVFVRGDNDDPELARGSFLSDRVLEDSLGETISSRELLRGIFLSDNRLLESLGVTAS
jgi:hypothetical protein